jgi:hypothetical protein
MTAFTAISGAAAAVRARILANATTLGSIKTIRDRDEDPAVIADNAVDLPVVCVIPLGDSTDQITFTMGGNDWFHEFDLQIVGYYQFSNDNKDVFKDLATVRQYAYDTLELFRGPTLAGFYPGCNALGATMDLGYDILADYVIYRYDISLRCQMYEAV